MPPKPSVIKKKLPPEASTASRLEISHGERIEIKDYLVSGKYTLFDFSSPYCAPCEKVKPLLETLADEDSEVAVRFVNINRPDVKGIDVNSPVIKQFPSVFPIPHFKLYDKKGSLLLEGDQAWAWFEDRLAKQKAANAPPEKSKKEPVLASVKEITRGERIELAEHAVKEKFTIFDFYSPACKPCVDMKPWLEKLAESNPDIVLRVVNINRRGIEAYIDGGSPVAKQYKIYRIPQFKVFGKDGKLQFEGQDAFNWVIEQLDKVSSK